MKRLSSALLLLSICLILGLVSSNKVEETGFDIEITYDTLEEAKSAIQEWEAPESRFIITGVSNTTIKLYTSSKSHLNSLKKRSQQVLVRSVLANYAGYLTYETMTAKLREYEAAYPSKFKLFSIGRSTQNRELWAVEISMTLGQQDVFKPNVKYIGNMHGDEVVGRELLMRYIERLLTDTSADVVEFVANTNIFILPTMNPDGFALGTRENSLRVDLNRNFPDQYRSSGGTEQTETRLVKEFLASRQWTLSANFHGGDLVANYPWDGRPDNQNFVENKSPDDDVFRTISTIYARTNPGMMTNRQFQNGITNGAKWYVLYGGMQDYNYIQHGCMEITLEVSMNKWPVGTSLPNFWNDNKDSMFNYHRLVHNGVRGIVTHANSNQPLEGVQVTVSGREKLVVKTRKENGAYFRILPAGTWNLTFSAPGFDSTSIQVTVPSWTPSRRISESYSRVDVSLRPSPPSPPVAPTAPVTPPPPQLPTTPSIIQIPSSPLTSNPSDSSPPSAVTTPSGKMRVPLITSSEIWVVPIFAVVGSFAAVALLVAAMVVAQYFNISLTGRPQSTSLNAVPSVSHQLGLETVDD